VLRAYEHVLVPESNLGQLVKLVRAEFLVDARSLTKVQGQPFRAAEIERAVLELLGIDPGPAVAGNGAASKEKAASKAKEKSAAREDDEEVSS